MHSIEGVPIMTQFPSAEAVHWQSLVAIGKALGLARAADETTHDFASRCHYHLDALMREHAHLCGDDKVIELMDLHDAIEDCFPYPAH